MEATKVTLGVAGVAVAGLKATGTASVLIGAGVGGAILLVGGGVAYIVIKSFDGKQKKTE